MHAAGGRPDRNWLKIESRRLDIVGSLMMVS